MTGSEFKAAVGAVLIVLLWSTGSVQADQPQVIAAEASPNGDGSYTVSATIRHGDTGWDHYADNFEVLGPDGTVLEY